MHNPGGNRRGNAQTTQVGGTGNVVVQSTGDHTTIHVHASQAGATAGAAADRTMKVFLSSTALDLVAYRRVVDDTILRLQQQSVVMERFGPLPGAPVEECERKAAACDVLVCVVAHRYGFEPEAGKGSVTRREVEAAKAAGKDVLVWIVDDAHPWTEKKEQDRLADPTVLADPARIAEVVAAVGALNNFKAWLKATFVCEFFTTPEDLGCKVAIALSTHVPMQAPSVAASPLPPQPPVEVRIVHALQPAPHFQGRERLMEELMDWAADLASPDRVWALVAAGGTGKTAVAEQVVRHLQPSEANVLVWSFYEQPEADAFLRECASLFLGEEEGAAGGRLERLQRGLRDGRPHLIVLDGLERVQTDAEAGRARGELADHTLKLLLRALANGLGRTRALVTSRYPLVDLQDWDKRGYRDTRLDDLSPEAAVAVLRGWGVTGEDLALRKAAHDLGYHALSVAVLGSYLASFAKGRIEAANEFHLDAVTGEDPRAAKLARVLAYYAEKLPPEERELLARLSVFPRGVSVELLGELIDVGGEVAGLLVNARPRLVALLESLRKRGLVFQYRGQNEVTWTAHPFLREQFRGLLGCPAERVFEVVAETIGAGLERRPDTKPTDAAVLDRYEALIEATRLAGRVEEALDLYWNGLGNFKHLGWSLGDYERGYRILLGFVSTGPLEDLAKSMTLLRCSELLNELGLFAHRLGRLKEAESMWRMHDRLCASLGDPQERSVGLQNSCSLALACGKLKEARQLASSAVVQARRASHKANEKCSQAYSGYAAHTLGKVAIARDHFEVATKIRDQVLYSIWGAQQARHLLDLGAIASARPLAQHGIQIAHSGMWSIDYPRFEALFARIDLVEGRDPSAHIAAVREETARTGDMEWIIEAHLLEARHLLKRGDVQGAQAEAEAGLLHAVACGYGLLRIELLVVLARIRLVWPDAPGAIQRAREALDLATAAECGYAWGEADAAQVWGEAYFAHGELVLAQRAFVQAQAVRQRIEHPGVGETEMWLARVGGVGA